MTLELTKDEFNCLRDHLSLANAKSHNHPYRTSQEKEAEILQAIKDHKSNGAIKRELKTSYEVINRIRKEKGLWEF